MDTDNSRVKGLRDRALFAAALGQSFRGKRDIYETFGWDKNPTTKDFYATYLRNAYARAVVNTPAGTAWRDPPEIVDDEDTEADTETSFESDVAEFENETRVWHYAKRTDKLAGIGQFGVMVIGWADGEDQDFSSPVARERLNTNSPADAIDWFRPLSQVSVEQIRYGDSGSGRWGRPEYYKIDFADENDSVTDGIFGQGEREQWVHHERILHVADGLLDDEVRGTPRLEPVYNNVLDIEKVIGSGSEAAYRTADRGIVANADPEHELDDPEGVSEEIEEYVHGYRRFMRVQGMEIESLGGDDVDPSGPVKANIEAISSATGIPQSVLHGKEIADRAKSEDLKEWYGKVEERREQFVTPSIVRPLLDRLVEFGVLSSPSAGDYTVEFPPLAEESAEDTSQVQLNRSKIFNNIPELAKRMDPNDITEFLENGEFGDIEMPDDDEALDPAAMDSRMFRDTPPADAPQPAMADGGEESADE